MKLELLVDSPEFWTRFARDVGEAQHSIYIQTHSFEGDRVGQRLRELLVASGAPDKRILVDYYTRYVLSDRFVYDPRSLLSPTLRQEVRDTAAMMRGLPAAGVQLRWTAPVGPLLVRFAARDHKKLITIDERISYLGGINFSEHNFAWHDLMLRIEDGAAASFLASDFHASWDGQPRRHSARLGPLELHSLDGVTNEDGYRVIFDLIAGARASIIVESPYLTYPFCDHLRGARARGVPVTVITPDANNKRLVRDYLVRECVRSGLDVRLYRGRMNHLKALLVDGERLVIGSSNFDYLSYRLQPEIIGIIDDAQLIEEFRRKVLIPDLAQCSDGATDGGWRGRWAELQLRAGCELLTYLARL